MAILLGVSGGSGSGKTYFAKALLQLLGDDECVVISQDNYYFDQSHRFDFDGGSVNFDHPEAIDFDLLANHLRQIKLGQRVEVPIYEFKTHKRLKDTISLSPRKFFILDGILILNSARVRGLLDESVFVDTSEDLRFSRRLKRDIEERGRTEEGVRKQFFNQVKPMHDQFVEPSKQYATYTLHENKDFNKQLDRFYQHLMTLK